MAFPNKKKRRITVDDQMYYWVASGNDGHIDLRVMVDNQGGQALRCCFDYHQEDHSPPGSGGHSLVKQFVVTPHIVRQVIELALSRGWTPASGGGCLNLGPLDHFPELRLSQNREYAIKQDSGTP